MKAYWFAFILIAIYMRSFQVIVSSYFIYAKDLENVGLCCGGTAKVELRHSSAET